MIQNPNEVAQQEAPVVSEQVISMESQPTNTIIADTTAPSQPSLQELDDALWIAVQQADFDEVARLEAEMEKASNLSSNTEQLNVIPAVSADLPVTATSNSEMGSGGVAPESPNNPSTAEGETLSAEQVRFKSEVDAARRFVPTPDSPAVQLPVASLDIPKPQLPPRPQLPHDRGEWMEEDGKAFDEYQDAFAKYQEEILEYNDKIVEARFSALQARLDSNDQQNQISQQKISEAERLWESNKKLQELNPSLKTTKDIVEVHGEVEDFARSLAVANGVRFNDTSLLQKGYSLLAAYNNGDARTLEAAKKYNIQAPVDFKKYVELSMLKDSLELEKSQLVADGIYGNNIPLEQVWILKHGRSPLASSPQVSDAERLQQQVNRAQANAIGALEKAVVTPSNAGLIDDSKNGFDQMNVGFAQNVLQQKMVEKGFTQDDRDFMLRFESGKESVHNPSVMDRYDSLANKLI